MPLLEAGFLPCCCTIDVVDEVDTTIGGHGRLPTGGEALGCPLEGQGLVGAGSQRDTCLQNKCTASLSPLSMDGLTAAAPRLSWGRRGWGVAMGVA